MAVVGILVNLFLCLELIVIQGVPVLAYPQNSSFDCIKPTKIYVKYSLPRLKMHLYLSLLYLYRRKFARY